MKVRLPVALQIPPGVGELKPVAQIIGRPVVDPDPIVDLDGRLANAIWTPNTEVQFAWTIRDALRTRISGMPTQTRTSEYLASLLNRIETYELDRDVANRVFARVGRSLISERLIPDIEQVVDRLLTRTVAQLKVAMGELTRAKKVGGTRIPSNSTAELGRSILEVMVNANEGPAHELYRSLRYAPPYLLGALAKAMGHSSSDGFVAELKGADASSKSDIIEWVSGAAESWMTLVSVDRARTQAAHPVTAQPSFQTIARDPSSVPELKETLERWSTGLCDFFQLPPAELRLSCSARMREAALALDTVFEKLSKALGPDLANRSVGGVDRAALVAEVAALPDGVLLTTNLESPKLLAKKTERVLLRFLEAGLFELAGKYGELIRADRRLQQVAALIPSEPGEQLGVSSALLSMLKHDLPPAAGESLLSYSQRLARTLSTEGVMEDRAEQLAQALHQDPTLLEELVDHFAQHRGYAAGLAEARSLTAAQEAQLDQGVMTLPVETLRAMEAHFRSTFPEEGLGYLVSDGRLTRFLPVINGLRGTELARTSAMDTIEGTQQLVELLQRNDLIMLGKVHSHPNESPVFSNMDLDGGTRVTTTSAPNFRTVIVEVSQVDQELVCRTASFRSNHLGKVIGEDQIALS
ncbi:MAG: Mov34/MPN/PAD-1 family protein [Deltaproteobacteria bacterium]|nr:Mov34/MPN/PAD-1 family protein [Deltaproteobacteria bacterium]